MAWNKELPKEEQLRIVLQNYDKKVTECEALKKDKEELQKQIEQKNILYKNMLNHFKENNKDDNASKENWESKYKVLKNAYAQRGEKYNTLHNEYLKTKRMVDSVRGVLCGAYNKIEDFCTNTGIGHKAVLAEDGNIEYEEPVTFSAPNKQEKKFISYVREVIENYKKTGSLRGIATIAREYGVSSLSKEQFFRFGLDEDRDFTDEYLVNFYKNAKSHK